MNILPHDPPPHDIEVRSIVHYPAQDGWQEEHYQIYIMYICVSDNNGINIHHAYGSSPTDDQWDLYMTSDVTHFDSVDDFRETYPDTVECIEHLL